MSEESCLKCVLEYLRSLPPPALDRIYSHSAACVTVFRCLSDVAQQLILRMVFVESDFPKRVILDWFEHSAFNECENEISELVALRIFNILRVDSSGSSGISLNKSFAAGVRDVIMCSKENILPGLKEAEADAKGSKTAAELKIYGNQRWESVLYFLALSSGESGQISAECRDVLRSSDFIHIDGGGDAPEITSKGFQFLLVKPQLQIWKYLLLYLKYLQAKNVDVVACLIFLFQLGFCTLGKAYSSEDFSDTVQDFLQHLREIGLVFQSKRKSMRFCPTHLAVELLGEEIVGESEAHKGYLVVETNFRVYIYTDSPLQLAVVSTFCDMMYRFPNMSVGVLTRESVRRALQAGIGADQIIEFLKSNAHDLMLTHTPILPPTITDQLKLWELERERFQFEPGVLYSQFTSDMDFILVRDYAKERDALLWQNELTRVMVVKDSSHDDVKRFWKKNKKSEP